MKRENKNRGEMEKGRWWEGEGKSKEDSWSFLYITKLKSSIPLFLLFKLQPITFMKSWCSQIAVFSFHILCKLYEMLQFEINHRAHQINSWNVVRNQTETKNNNFSANKCIKNINLSKTFAISLSNERVFDQLFICVGHWSWILSP